MPLCAFSKGPLSLDLRGTPYLLDDEEIQRRVAEAVECGATEVCLQGGIHPDFDGDYYLGVIRAVKEVAPAIHVHGFTALEVTEGARRLGVRCGSTSEEARDAGLATLPGTAAEISTTRSGDHLPRQDRLVEGSRPTGGALGRARSNVSIMFRPRGEARARRPHFVRTRALQKETGGFTSSSPPVRDMATPLFLQKRPAPGRRSA